MKDFFLNQKIIFCSYFSGRRQTNSSFFKSDTIWEDREKKERGEKERQSKRKRCVIERGEGKREIKSRTNVRERNK